MVCSEQLRNIAETEMDAGGVFVYDMGMMHDTAESLLASEIPTGLTVRYAAKANPHPQIIAGFDQQGVHFDASSPQEALELVKYGVDGPKISMSSQSLFDQSLSGMKDLVKVVGEGVLPVATSLRQISVIGGLGVKQMAIRLNPGEGDGHNNRTTVGGPASSFGIWKDLRGEAKAIAESRGITIDRIHTHIGSGVDPSKWRKVIQNSLAMVVDFPDVRALDIGGGYKIARMPGEEPTDMKEVMDTFAEELIEFRKSTGREIKLEIEPGTFLVGNAGTLLGRIEESVSTPSYDFLKLNVGMNANARPTMYGAQHPIKVLNDSDKQKEYVVTGSCCESGDILTPTPGDPEGIKTRVLNEAQVGDFVAIGGAGAYCASMSPDQYNAIPHTTDYFVEGAHLILDK